MRETSSSKNIRLAGQARARPSSITSSAHSVEAPSPNNNHRHQPSAETRRPAAESTPGPALYHSRSPRSIGKDFRPTTGPIPTSFPQGNTSAHRNDASLNHPKPATSNFKHWAPPSVSSATPSPPRSFETDDSTPLPSQAEKRPRQDEPIPETEGKRKKTNARERTPKKIRDEFQPNPTIIAWAVEDGKGEKDKFRAFYAPSRSEGYPNNTQHHTLEAIGYAALSMRRWIEGIAMERVEGPGAIIIRKIVATTTATCGSFETMVSFS
ncbi:hypothetical protein M413DRAFT_14562 [Hebeloma cylindrosporum]|uniref:Uncharacterized protein n=1 Tax=Hebeloma cylindrosporum TaxID=76867 RepID=A0A0C3BVG1_HEBCY|nr:hypothetical protein M413DRAFT_14562 [Hebeloma cylindrosporum h7]